MHYKDLLTIVGVLLSLTAFVRYVTSAISGQTRPHAFSFLAWALAESSIFAVQIIGHAGIGAWITGFNAATLWIVTTVALVYGDRKFTPLDWVSFLGSLLALLLWALTKNPLVAVVFLIVSDATAYSITFRKAYYKPYSETLASYAISGLKSLIALFALQNYAVANWLFLAYLVTGGTIFIAMTLIRRRQLKQI